MRRSAVALLAAVVPAALAGARPSAAKVAHISLKQLARNADRIVIARVTELRRDNGILVATAAPEQTLKGARADQPLHFVAEPTWRCDTSKAVNGETVLLFLNRVAGNKVRVMEKAVSVVASSPLYLISDSGRGRMPIRTLGGQRYVTLWTGDIQLPRQIKTRPDPDHDRESSIRAALLAEITASLAKP